MPFVVGLHYGYVIHTDVTDCYGSVYTHTIPWALHDKEVAKNNRGNSLLGNKIDALIRDMSHGQTNGIPQGSILMDFVAELVLGYADMLLSERLSNIGIDDYKIVRYRDDYRIFTNNPVVADQIMKCLTEVLVSIGMRLSPQKTLPSDDLIRSAIKPDKLFWNTATQKRSSLQKHLLIINELSYKYPNSGSLTTALTKFFERVTKIEDSLDGVKALIGIIVNIAYRNPRVYPVATGVLSRLLQDLNTAERNSIIDSILRKFDRLPNTGHIKVWLQRVTIKNDRQKAYDELLCKKVNDQTVEIWNLEFLTGEIKNIIETTSIVDEAVISSMDEIISVEEVSVFAY